MRITPEALAEEFTLPTAATRLDFLSRRDDGDTRLNRVVEVDPDDWSTLAAVGTSLDVSEALELLALGEVVARKAHGSQLIGIRAALRGGAGWADIADALGMTPRRAWESYRRVIDEQVEGRLLAPEAAVAARALAGGRP